MDSEANGLGLLCPSAHPEMAQSRIFGVMGGSVEEPRVIYLEEPTPAAPDVLALAGPVKPIEVFRIAATCVESACRHFDGKDCQLAARIVQILPAVTEALPACRIRQDCRWFEQEGRPACLRCPQVITQNYSPSEEMVRAATPA
jgi:hypothetical protein